MPKLFPGNSKSHYESNNTAQFLSFVTSSRLTNINVIPIDYAFQLYLRGRLTLRRLTLHRKPWTFGGNVSYISLRYSCQHSHLRYLQQILQFAFTDLRNAPLPLVTHIGYELISSVYNFSLATFMAQHRNWLVSYYAFFKGWLLLSPPPSCFDIRTTFHT